MKKIWSRLPVFYKIFITLLLFVFIGQLLVILYIWQNEADVLLEKEKKNLTKELLTQADQLTLHLSSLAKETRFLASLEVMDDLVAQDIDKRVGTLITRRADDLGENIILIAMNQEKFIASSRPNFIGQTLTDMQQKLMKEYLYFYAPVYASFDKTKYLGAIVMLYPLKNLTSLQTNDHDNGKRLWLTTEPTNPLFPDISLKNHIIVSQMLHGILNHWILHLGYQKSKALLTLKHIENILILTFLFSVLMLGIVVWIISKKLTSPINTLLKTSEEISSTHDYSKQVEVNSQDEIGALAVSFNTLIQKTHDLFIQLEEQNREHQKKLLELIAFFNAIIDTDNEKETIATALSRIKLFTGAKESKFIAHKSATEAQVPVKMYDYTTKRVEDIGTITLEGLSKKPFDNAFFMPLSKMIQLQLEHISLFNGTKEALEAKSTFLSIISHELRTPLGSILNLTQHLMMKPHIKLEESEMLRRIETSAEHLLSMINNILQLSKLESNSMTTHKEKVNLTMIFEEIFDMIEPLIEEKGLFFYKDLPKDLFIYTDTNLFKQVIINLLSNAVKFTHKGGITFDVIKEQESFIITVSDTGIGIDAKRQKDLFTAFYQTHFDINSLKNSSGLGLALSQKVAHLINGHIMVESEGLGKGTKATFTLKSIES